MPIDYSLGKIYKISSPSNNIVYYGSTAQKHISTRIAGHLKDYKRYLNGKQHYISSFKVLECEDYKVELLEDYPCNNNQQLKARERWYIENNDCVNKNIPGRTKRESDKQYRENNREEILKYQTEKITCECGCEIRRSDLARHKRSNKHLAFLEQNKK